MICLRNVSKRYHVYRRPLDRLMASLPFAGPAGRWREEFWALRNVDLEIPPGATFGVVGPNGAGKSTLLKLIAGTTFATEGSVRVDGRAAALLELGSGFHPEFSGRQNIYINGKILGLTEELIREREQEIIDFAELGAFIDQPLRTYSSGMVARLGFAVAARVEPDVLIVDEALSVGDAYFAQKCVERIREFKRQGATILFVSHDPSAVLALCDEAVLLEKGRIVFRGAPRDVLEEYNAVIARQGERNRAMRRADDPASAPAKAEPSPEPLPEPAKPKAKKPRKSKLSKFKAATPKAAPVPEPPEPSAKAPEAPAAKGKPSPEAPAPTLAARRKRMGSFLAVVDKVALCSDKAPEGTDALVSGEPAWIDMEVAFLAPTDSPTVGVMFKDRLGLVAFATNTRHMGLDLGRFEAGEALRLRWRFDCRLGPGDYTLTVAAHAGASHVEDCFDWIDGALGFRVAEPPGFKFYGATRLDPEIEQGRGPSDAERAAGLAKELFRGAPSDLEALDAEEAAPFLSRGWHRPESTAEGRAFRWSEPEACFALTPATAALRVEAAAWGRPSDGEPLALEIATVDGSWRGEIVLTPNEWAWKETRLPNEFAGEPRLFRLRCPALVADGRRLGAAVFGFRTSEP